MQIEKTSTYPTRYAAFERSGILFVHDKPQQSGGHEWAVFFDEKKNVYGSIVSYRDQGFIIEVGAGSRGKSERMPYDYQRAEKFLVRHIEEALLHA